MVQDNIAEILSAPDDAPSTFGTASAAAPDLGGGRPNAYALGLVDAPTQTALPATAEQVKLAQAAGLSLPSTTALERGWYTVRNFFTITIPGLFTSASTRLRALVGAPTTVTTTDKSGGTSTSIASSSWLVWVFLAGAVAAVFFAMKKKGGKSFLPKLGAKSSVKLR